MRDVITGWLAIVVLLTLVGWVSGTLGAFDQRAILAWIVATPPLLFAAHRLIPVILPRLLATEGLQRTAIIAGANETGCRLAERIGANPLLGIRVAGFFDDRAAGRNEAMSGSATLGSLGRLAEYVKAHRIDLIYIALPMASQPRILRLLEELHDTTASIYFAPDIHLIDLIQARVDTIGGLPVIAVCESPFYGASGLIKRVSDIVLASAILVLISPFMLAIAIGVKLSSPGPVLFKQRRYGLDGREIVVYKFRTMRVLEDGNVIRQATRDDPRVTRFGVFLRAFSLDELPQFINVLQGRMSVVGPRPHAIAHNEMYRKLIRGYMIRHKVKPGITGLAQVNGLRGETSSLDKHADAHRVRSCVPAELVVAARPADRAENDICCAAAAECLLSRFRRHRPESDNRFRAPSRSHCRVRSAPAPGEACGCGRLQCVPRRMRHGPRSHRGVWRG